MKPDLTILKNSKFKRANKKTTKIKSDDKIQYKVTNLLHEFLRKKNLILKERKEIKRLISFHQLAKRV